MARHKKDLSNLLLILNGTEERLQIVLGTNNPENPEVIAAQEWTVPGQSVKFLTPSIENMLSSLEVPFSAINGIACVTGPGSFTGLRIVLAAAEGIAMAQNIPTASLPYLPLLAQGPLEFSPFDIFAVTHSRRGQVYLQGFSAETAEAITQAAPVLLQDIPEIVSLSSSTDEVIFFGSGTKKYPDFFESLAMAGMKFSILPQHWDSPRPADLLYAAVQAEYNDEPLEPIYLRGSDAEENLSQIAAKRGIDVEEATKMISRPIEESIRQ